MQPFATDSDLLHWEPGLLRDAAAVAQTLLSGTGTLAGTTFTIASGSLLDAHIAPEHVITIGSPIDSSFQIVSVDDASNLTLSVIDTALDPDNGPAQPWAPFSGSNLGYAIRTFWPQRRIVSELLLQAAGVKPQNAASILNRDVLRRPCVLGSLHLVYTALSAAATEPLPLLNRAEMYERLYRRALRNTAVDIDLDGDGVFDTRRTLNVLKLIRT
ncbi:hypothetical protein [Fontivita pretiosa]|uniref:hypothetical protein n=1 Tax=Fontivita pretiosa TaxID=2989684 RepID=UPI003D17A07D